MRTFLDINVEDEKSYSDEANTDTMEDSEADGRRKRSIQRVHAKAAAKNKGNGGKMANRRAKTIILEIMICREVGAHFWVLLFFVKRGGVKE